jgi:hypothetical protein
MVEAEKSRGGCLVVFLIVMMVANAAVALIYALALLRGPETLAVPTWALLLFMALGVVNFVAAIAIWRWRRLGVYTFCALAPVVFLVNIAIHAAPLAALAGFLGPLILILLVWRKWPQMQ